MTRFRASTLIGLLVSMTILLVLGVVVLNAINKALTGAGSTLPGSAASSQDQQCLVALFASMAADSLMSEGRFPVPADVSRSRDVSLNTTAGLFSALIAGHHTVPGQVVSANENNPNVLPDDDYDYRAIDPVAGVHWDPRFTADLASGSNVSFAHVPLYGRRLSRHWRFTAGSRTAVMGNRGPRDGIDDPSSYTYGRDGRWAGHVVFGDGHVEFLESFVPPGMLDGSGSERLQDNLFAMEEGASGGDAILTFTRIMEHDGPVIQHD